MILINGGIAIWFGLNDISVGIVAHLSDALLERLDLGDDVVRGGLVHFDDVAEGVVANLSDFSVNGLFRGFCKVGCGRIYGSTCFATLWR